MFPAILPLAINQIVITDEDSDEQNPDKIPRQVFNKTRLEPPSDSFLSVLDDKNKTISALKKQLQNQKLQLAFYIEKEMDHSKIVKLAESCTPQASDESLPLNLALNKFCRQAGIKTKLTLLYEHMNHLDRKISYLLKDQEFVLRKIVNKLCELVKCRDIRYVNFKTSFGRFITDPLHVDLFDKLLGATLSLRRKLDSFKICCDRVLLIEEERNYLVEQVYSMPVEDRMNCNYLLGIQMEKAELENEIKRISRHRAESSCRIKELNVIEKILHNLQWELNSSYLKNEQESCIAQMLKKINSEARILLEMTKEQKRRVSERSDDTKTKCPDRVRIILYIRTASSGTDGETLDETELERCGLKSEEEIRLFQTIKSEVVSIKNKIRQESAKQMKALKEECESLKTKITHVLLDNSRTKVSNSALKQELEEMKLERKNGLQRLKQERDVYKAQVEDLQAIREAYAQLVDKQPNTEQMERDFLEQIDERDKKILDLQHQASQQNQEIEKLKARILDQNEHIGLQNRYINLTKPGPSTDSEYKLQSKTAHQSAQQPLIYPPPANQKKENIKGKSHKTQSNKRNPGDIKEDDKTEQPKSAVTSGTPTKKLAQKYPNATIHSKEFHSNIEKDNSKSKKIETRQNTISKAHNKHIRVLSSLKKSVEEADLKKFPSPAKKEESKLLTCRKVYAETNKKTSDMTITSKSGEVENNFKMETTSVFSMEIKYTNTTDKGLLDEFELFKDCSVESV